MDPFEEPALQAAAPARIRSPPLLWLLFLVLQHTDPLYNLTLQDIGYRSAALGSLPMKKQKDKGTRREKRHTRAADGVPRERAPMSCG